MPKSCHLNFTKNKGLVENPSTKIFQNLLGFVSKWSSIVSADPGFISSMFEKPGLAEQGINLGKQCFLCMRTNCGVITQGALVHQVVCDII